MQPLMPNSRTSARLVANSLSRRASIKALSSEQPFPGLRPFSYMDHSFFFGREEQIYALYNLLGSSQFVAIVGSSGSGKSSLVSAGLLPLLDLETEELQAREGNGSDERGWKWIELRPGTKPLSRLAEALTAISVCDGEGGSTADIEDMTALRERLFYTLQRSSFGLTDALIGLDAVAGHKLLIVVDQFEELFRYTEAGDATGHQHEEAAQFVQLLLEATSGDKRGIYALITMRSDFIGSCERFDGLPEAVSGCQFLVPSLTRERREQVIRKPLEKAGATIEPVLVERLLNDSVNDFDSLPILQHCLLRLWEIARDSAPRPKARRMLRLEDYEAVGQITGALSQHANSLVDDLQKIDPAKGRAVQRVFRALSERDPERRAIRRRVLSFGRLRAETGIADNELRYVLDRLRADDCSFLVPSLSAVPVLDDETRIDIGHEALLRRWEKTAGRPDRSGQVQAGWIDQELADGDIYRGLLARARSGDTLGSKQLKAQSSWWGSLQPTEAWAERYGGELTKIQQLLEDSRKEIRRSRITAGLISAVFLGVSFGLACILLYQARTQTSMELAQVESNLARYIERGRDALMASRYTDAAVILAVAYEYQQRSGLGDNPGLRMLFQQATDSISTGASQIHAENGPVDHLALSSEGRWIATAGSSEVRLWDGEGRLLRSVSASAEGSVTAMQFDPNGRRLAIGQEGRVELYQVPDMALIATGFGHQAKINAIEFSSDGTELMTAGEDGTVNVWGTISQGQNTLSDLAGTTRPFSWNLEGREWGTGSAFTTHSSPGGNAALVELTPPQAAPKRLDFLNEPHGSPSATLAISGSPIRTNAPVSEASFALAGKVVITLSGGVVSVWNRRQVPKTELSVVFPGGERVAHTRVDPSGKLLAAGGVNGTISVYDLLNKREILHATMNKWPVTAIAFDKDGSRVLFAHADGRAWLWQSGGGENAEFRFSGMLDLGQQQMQLGGGLSDMEKGSPSVRSIGFSPLNPLIITAYENGTLAVWNYAAHLVSARTLRGSALEDMVLGVQRLTSSMGATRVHDVVVASDAHGYLYLWGVGPAVFRAPIEHREAVTSIRFDRAGAHAITASQDGTAVIWRVSDMRPERITRAPSSEYVLDAELSRDGRRAMTVSASQLTLGDASATEAKEKRPRQEAEFTQAIFAEGAGGIVAAESPISDPSALKEQHVALWSNDLSSSRDLDTFTGRRVRKLQLSTDGKFLLVLTSYDELRCQSIPIKGISEKTGISDGIIAKSHPYYALGTRDGRVGLYWFTGDLYHNFMKHNGRVTALAFSGDDKLIASAGEIDEPKRPPHPAVRVFDTESGDLKSTLPSPDSSPIASMEFARNGAILLARTDGGMASIWDVSTGQPLAVLQPAGAGLSAVRFTPDGSTVIGGTRAGDVFLWKLEGHIEDPAKVMDDVVQRVAEGQFTELSSDYLAQEAWAHLNPNAKWKQEKRDELEYAAQLTPSSAANVLLPAYSSHPDDPDLRLATAAVLHDFDGLRGTVRAQSGLIRATLWGDAGFVTTARDGTAKIWDLKSGKEILPDTELRLSAPATVLSVQPDGHLAIIASTGDSRPAVWDLRQKQQAYTIDLNGAKLQDARFSWDGTRLLLQTDNGDFRIVSGSDGKTGFAQLPWGKEAIADENQFDLSRTGTVVAIGKGHELLIWHTRLGSQKSAIIRKPMSSQITMVGISRGPGKPIILTVHADNVLHVWDPDDGHELAQVTTNGVPSWAGFNYGGDSVGVITPNGGALWKIDEKHVTELAESDGVNSFMAFSRDGTRLFAPSERGSRSFRIWDAITRRPVGELAPFDGYYRLAGLSRDGRTLITAENDGRLRFWDMQAAPRTVLRLSQTLVVPKPHARAADLRIQSVQYTAHGKFALTEATDRSIVLWNLSRRRALVFRKLASDSAAYLSNDGSRVITVEPKSIDVLDAQSGKVVKSLRNPTNVVRGELSPLGQHLALATTHGIFIFNLETGDTFTLGHDASFAVVHFGGDDVVGGLTGKGNISLWNLDGERIFDLDGAGARDFRFSTDARKLVSFGGSAIVLFNVATTRREALLAFGKIVDARFTEHDLLTFSADGMLQTWTIGGEEPTIKLETTITAEDKNDPFVRAVFSEDNRFVLTTARSGRVTVWDLDGDALGSFDAMSQAGVAPSLTVGGKLTVVDGDALLIYRTNPTPAASGLSQLIGIPFEKSQNSRIRVISQQIWQLLRGIFAGSRATEARPGSLM
jgi:WD40 repeat protein